MYPDQLTAGMKACEKAGSFQRSLALNRAFLAAYIRWQTRNGQELLESVRADLQRPDLKPSERRALKNELASMLKVIPDRGSSSA